MSEIEKKEYGPLVTAAAVWSDRRLFNIGHFGNAYKLHVPETLTEHRRCRAEVIRRLRLAAGLVPDVELPENPAKVSSPKVYEGVLIYDVEIETMPGLRLTGNLFVPEKRNGRIPGLLCPHGHWQYGRVHHDPARGGVVMRCIEFARLGFAVFAYDMAGFNDCNDVPHYFSQELKEYADLYGVSTFGMQTVNSMRAVDFIAGRQEVDAERIGCTGASGGASQTWFIAALDKRIKAIAPVCMLSASFQGGCACEEPAMLRVNGLTNFDILASLAPMPILLPSVNGDWTNGNPLYEIPRLKEVYKLYNAADRIENFHYDDGHNYNQRTREHVYAWFVKQFMGEDRGIRIPEEDIPVPPPELLWHKGCKPEPADAEHSRKTIDQIAGFLNAKALDYGNDLTAWQNDRRELLREMISSDIATMDVAMHYSNQKWPIDGGVACPEILMRRGVGDVVGNLYFCPDEDGNGKAFLFVLPKTYRDCMPGGRYYDLICSFMQKKMSGSAVELLGNPDLQHSFEQRLRKEEENRCHSAFNQSWFAMRVQDIITSYTRMSERGHKNICIVAPAESAPEALAACALLNGPEAIIDLDGLGEDVWNSELKYQEMIFKIGGLAGLIIINASKSITYCNVPQYVLSELEKMPVNIAAGTFSDVVKQ